MKAFIPLLLIGLISWLSIVSGAPQSAGGPRRDTGWRYRATRHRPIGIPANRDSRLRPVLKGEYICGDKVCKLKPGEVPKGCNGICQYPLGPPKPLT